MNGFRTAGDLAQSPRRSMSRKRKVGLIVVALAAATSLAVSQIGQASKSTRTTAMATFEVRPRLNQMTNSDANTIRGSDV
jgi:hypothetical protein